jgi:integrase
MKSRPARPESTSWTDAVARFQTHLEHEDRSAHTTHHYRDDLRAFAAWWAKTSTRPLTPAAVTKADVRMWRDFLRTDPLDTITGRRRKPAAVNAKLSALKSFLNWAKEAGIIDDVPEIPRRERLGAKAVKSLDKLRQQQLLRQAADDRNPRNMLMVEIMLETGLRVAELVALRWLDVPFSERKGTVKVTAGKGRKPRDIPMSPDALRAFKDLRELDPEAPPTAPVFASQRFDAKRPGCRKPLSPRGVQELLNKLGKALRWEDPLHPHMLRHSFAMNHVRKGTPFPTIAKLMGHSSVVTTMAHYGTPSEDDLRRAVGALADDD